MRVLGLHLINVNVLIETAKLCKLSHSQLIEACEVRAIDTRNTAIADLRERLRQWTLFSTNVISFELGPHLDVLPSY